MRPALLAALLGLSALAAHAQPRTPLPPGVEVVAREDWGGPPPVGPMIPQVPVALTIHHSGERMRTDRTPAEAIRQLYEFSTRRDTLGDGTLKEPWPDVPYHFFIAPDGTVLEARDVAFEGDTNTRYDLSGHALVVVEGNFEEEQPTAAQVASLLALSEGLARQWGFGPETVAGHRDLAPEQTVCPGDALEARFPEIRAAVAAGARRSLDGEWTLASAAASGPARLALRAGPDGRLRGTAGGVRIGGGRLSASTDALHFAFHTRGPDGTSVTQGAVRGGRLEASTLAPDGTLSVWTAVRPTPTR